MKIRCKECKTIYDNSEKYCPYCFNRTNTADRYKVSQGGNRIEGSEMEKRKNAQFDYQKRATSKFKKKESNEKIKTALKIGLGILILVLSILLDIFA